MLYLNSQAGQGIRQCHDIHRNSEDVQDISPSLCRSRHLARVWNRGSSTPARDNIADRRCRSSMVLCDDRHSFLEW